MKESTIELGSVIELEDRVEVIEGEVRLVEGVLFEEAAFNIREIGVDRKVIR